MTRDQANDILFLWKIGAENFTPRVIDKALYATGDLNGASSEAGVGVVHVPSSAARMEGAGLALCANARTGVPVSVLATAGTAYGGNAKAGA